MTFIAKPPVLSFVVVVLVAAGASAEAPFGAETTSPVKNEVKGIRAEGDGTYGRLDGDLDLGFGLGALVDLEHGEPGAAARVSGHWFFMAGGYVSYADALGTALDPKRRLGLGVDLRPLFLPRWTSAGFERGWLLDTIWHMVLPVICLTYGGFAVLTK